MPCRFCERRLSRLEEAFHHFGHNGTALPILKDLQEILADQGVLEDAQINASLSNGLGEACAVLPCDVDDLINILAEGMDFADEDEEEAFAFRIRSTFMSAEKWLGEQEDTYGLDHWYDPEDWHEVARRQ